LAKMGRAKLAEHGVIACKEVSKMKCAICGKDVPRGGVMVIDCGTKIEICAECASIVEEAGRMIKTETMVSKPAYDYLESSELKDALCEECPWNKYHEGYFNYASGAVDPPWHECPADFDFTSDKCAMRNRFFEIVELLAEADQIAGMRKGNKIKGGDTDGSIEL